MRFPPAHIALLGILAAAGCVEGRQVGVGDQADNGANGAQAIGLSNPTNSAGVPLLLAALSPRAGGPSTASRSISDALMAAADRTRGVHEDKPACPPEMVLVSGQFCPEVEQRCTRWMETEGRYAYFRCAEYARPAKCLSTRVSMRFCIDRDEYAPPGEALPASNQSWTDAQRTCSSLGKRVCMESEWNFSCEGEEMRPYPYGFTRNAEACNADRTDIYRSDGRLLDLRDGADGHPDCVSPFGVHNLSGNLEEWTTIDGTRPTRPAMKGAYWQPSRNHCRAAQTAHDEFYHGDETGFRCCKSAE